MKTSIFRGPRLIGSTDAHEIGETVSGDENNMSLDRLAKDLKNVVHAVYGEQPPDIVLVGHRYTTQPFRASGNDSL